MPADDSPARAEAAFLGLAIGDALGATSEFMTPAEIRSRYGVLRQIRGGGWLGLRPGQVTDDTEMSLALARAVLACGGWSLPAIADALVAWMRSKPIDIGATVRKGLRSYMLGGGLTVPPNDWDAGNGAVMRMAPVALLTFGDAALLRRCSLEQAHLTHNHPLSDAACVCVGRMLQAALAGADRFCLHALTRELVALHPTFRFDPYSGRASGYVVETLQTVFHFLFTTDSFEDCLVGVVNQGGAPTPAVPAPACLPAPSMAWTPSRAAGSASLMTALAPRCARPAARCWLWRRRRCCPTTRGHNPEQGENHDRERFYPD